MEGVNQDTLENQFAVDKYRNKHYNLPYADIQLESNPANNLHDCLV
jgi:hypothetical protein